MDAIKEYLDKSCFLAFWNVELKHLSEDEYSESRHCIHLFFDWFDIPGRSFGCVVGVLYHAEVSGPAVF